MFDKQVAKLGAKLSDAFTERARHYFSKAGEQPNEQAKINMLVMGAMLGEVAKVISDVTKRESAE